MMLASLVRLYNEYRNIITTQDFLAALQIINWLFVLHVVYFCIDHDHHKQISEHRLKKEVMIISTNQTVQSPLEFKDSLFSELYSSVLNATTISNPVITSFIG